MKKTILVILIAVALLVLIFFLVKIAGKGILPDLMGTTSNTSTDVSYLKGEKLLNKKVPYFDLPSTSLNRVKLKDYTGKPFIIVFWATWNLESVNQIKILDEYITSTKKKEQLFSIIAISNQEEESVVKSFMRRGGYDVIVGIDKNGSTGVDFNIKALPTTIFVDSDGYIRDIYTGVLNNSMLVDKVEPLLK